MTAAVMARSATAQAPTSAAIAWRDCAPWDGPAFTVAVGRPGAPEVDRARPWLWISIWHPPDARRPVTYQFPDTDGKTGAVLYRGTAFPSVTGTVTFPRLAFGEDIDGSFDLVAPGGERLAGRFRGRWSPEVALCGEAAR